MNTGNIKNLRVNGQLVIRVNSILDYPVCEFDPNSPTEQRFFAQVSGWHAGCPNVGTGRTKEAAIRSLARQCGFDPVDHGFVVEDTTN